MLFKSNQVASRRHLWDEEIIMVKSAIDGHPEKLGMLESADREMYLVLCHFFGIGGHECCATQLGVVQHMADLHQINLTNNQVHDLKWAGICILSDLNPETNRVQRKYDAAMKRWRQKGGITIMEMEMEKIKKMLLKKLKGELISEELIIAFEECWIADNRKSLNMLEIFRRFVNGSQEYDQIARELNMTVDEVALTLKVIAILAGIKISDVSSEAFKIFNQMKVLFETRIASESTDTEISRLSVKRIIHLSEFYAWIWEQTFDELLRLVDDISIKVGNKEIIWCICDGRHYATLIRELIMARYPEFSGDNAWIRSNIWRGWHAKGIIAYADDSKKVYKIFEPASFSVVPDPNRGKLLSKLGHDQLAKTTYIDAESKKVVALDNSTQGQKVLPTESTWEIIQRLCNPEIVRGLDADLTEKEAKIMLREKELNELKKTAQEMRAWQDWLRRNLESKVLVEDVDP